MSKDKSDADKLRAEIDHRHAAAATHAGGCYLRNDAGELVPDPEFAPKRVDAAVSVIATTLPPAQERVAPAGEPSKKR